MATLRNRWLGGTAMALLAAGLTLAPPPSAAQQRMLIPEGTVLTVRTEGTINSSAARVGQTFRTTMAEPLRVEGYTVFPQGSVIQGVVTQVRPASRSESGIVGVEFNRLTLPTGRTISIQGKLTSMDPAERRQIDAQADPRVVFVGGRAGVGAAIAGIGANDLDNPVAGVLGALGSLFSTGADVNVPPGTMLAVQLERALYVTSTGTPSYGSVLDEYSLYTSAQMIRAAQQALRQRDYYRGSVDGQLDEETQRALFEFQSDNGIMPTGNLDARTAQALGLSLGTGSAYGYMTAETAAAMRRSAQSLVGQWRGYLGVQGNGRFAAGRDYRAAELEAYFALSAFADNASLYEQMVRNGGSGDGLAAATEALSASARRVDDALRGASAPARFTSQWQQIRGDLGQYDGSGLYR